MSFDEDPRENECPNCHEYEKERIKLQSIMNDLGSWASAAQEDPTCCQKLKDIFLRVIEEAVVNTDTASSNTYNEYQPNTGQGEL